MASTPLSVKDLLGEPEEKSAANVLETLTVEDILGPPPKDQSAVSSLTVEDILGPPPETLPRPINPVDRRIFDTLQSSPLVAPEGESLTSPSLPASQSNRDGLIAAIRKGVENIPQHLKASAGGLLEAIGDNQQDHQGEATGAVYQFLQSGKDADFSQALKSITRRPPKLSAGTPTGQALFDKGKAIADEAQAKLKENAFKGPRGSLPYYVNAIVGGLGTMALPVAATVVSPTLGATLMASQVYGEKYAEQLTKGRNEQQAAQDAAFYALSEAIPEKFVFESFLRGGRGILKKIFKGALTEGAQESLSEALQAGYDAGILKEDMSFKESVLRVLDAGIVGFFTGGPIAAVMHPFSREEASTPEPRQPSTPPHGRPMIQFGGGPFTRPSLIQSARQETSPSQTQPVNRPAPEERAINAEDLLGEVISPAADEGAPLGTPELSVPQTQPSSPASEQPPLPAAADQSPPETIEAREADEQREQVRADLQALDLPPEDVQSQLQTARELGLLEPTQQEKTTPFKPEKIKAQGKSAEVFTPQGTPIAVQYHLADAHDLMSSHDNQGHPNPRFPQALQPRDRSRSSSAAQIARIAGNLKPEFLADSPKAGEGAPIVSPEGVVESGNGRVAALRRHYRQGGDKYKRYLIDNAERFGLDPQAVSQMSQPVLVRVRQTPMDEAQRAEFTRQANQSDLAGLSPVETARADAARITPEMMASYVPAENGSVLSASNQPFLKAFTQAIGPEETAALTSSSGELTRQMADRVQAAVFQKAYGHDRLLNLFAEEADPEIKNILSALNVAAPAFAKARALNENLGEVDIITPLVKAIDIIRENKGRHLKEAIAQQDAFTDQDPIANKLALFMDENKRSAKRLGAWMMHMGQRVEATLKSGQNDALFDLPPIDMETIADEAIQQYTAQKQNQEELFSSGPVQPNDAPGRQFSQPVRRERAEAEDTAAAEGRSQENLAPQKVPQETAEATTQRYPKQAALKEKAQRKRKASTQSQEAPAQAGVFDSGGKETASKHRFGDEEIARAIVPRIASTFTEARAAAKAFQGKPITNTATGIEAVVSRNTLDKMLSHKAVGKSQSAAVHALAVANLDTLFQRARLGWRKPDKAGDPNIKGIYRFFTPLVHEDKARLAKLTVKETARTDQPNPLYTVEAVEFNKNTPAAQWVDSTVRSDGIDPTSTRSAEDIQNLAQRLEAFNLGEADIRLSRATPPTQGTDRASLVKHTAKLLRDWQNRPGVNILSRFDELPAPVQKAALKASDGSDIEGVFWKGQVYLVAENIASPKRAEEVLFHEILGHYGLRGMLGEQLTPLLNQVYLASGRSGLQAIAQRYGLDLNTREGRLIAAEEKLAHLAQRGEKPKLLQKLYAQLRDWLRQMGFSLKLNDADIAGLLDKAARFVREGRKDQLTDLEKIPRFQQVFHQNRQEEGASHYSRKQAPVLFRPDPQAAESYRQRLKKTMASARTLVEPISLGRTPAVLKALGAPDLPMTITRDVVRKATNGVKHHVPMAAIERLPEELADPLLVFEGGKDFPSHVILTEQKDLEGKPVLVALHLKQREGRLFVNRIASTYGKTNVQAMQGWIKEGKLRYQSERSPAQVRLIGLQLPQSGSPARGSKPYSPVLKGLPLPNSVSEKTSPKTILGESDIKSTLDEAISARFSRRLEEATEENPPDLRTRRYPQRELTRAPIDRVYQAAFELVQIPRFTQAAERKVKKLITQAQFKEEGKLAWLNPMIETARAGLIDRYGLNEAYKGRDQARSAEERRTALKGTEIVKRLQESGIDNLQEAKALQAVLTGEAIGDQRMRTLSAPVREAIDQLGQEAVVLGLLDEATYEKNKMTYLHRVYQKHETEQSPLGQWVGKTLASRRRKIIGNTFKGRGMTFKVGQSRLIEADGQPAVGIGTPGERVIGGRPRKFVVLDRVRDGKVLGRKFLPAEDPRLDFFNERETLPESLQGWTHRGTWEVRGKQGDKVILWRDFTEDERHQMGEILDARYTVGKTFLLMAQDLANGRFLKDISENPEWTWQHAGEPDGLVGEASGRYGLYTQFEWVRVPETPIPNTGGKKAWGHLAGKYVRAEIWRDLNQLQTMQSPQLWRKMLTQWKLNKTARNPVVHMNNVMSNFMLMDLAGVHLRDLGRAVYAMRHKTEDYQEALERGAFGGNFVTQEVQREVLNPILDEMLRQNYNGPGGLEAHFGLIGKLWDIPYRGLKHLDHKMINAYQLEDEIFRMAVYLKRRAEGMESAQAGSEAREQFLNYDIRAPWVNAARNTVLPFASYTYRAVPVLAKTLAERPWKLAKYFTMAYVANAMAYALMPGDEEEERKSLRKEAQGWTWLGMPRMLRLPIKDKYHNPLFIDIRRWIPAGDIFDMNQGQSALPIPAWFQMGGPIMLAGEFMLNKTAFTGKAIANYKTDTFGEKTQKVGDWLWKSWMPSAPWMPKSWYWDKISQSLSGARDRLGRRYEPGYAIASSLGIKISPQDVDLNMMWKRYEFESDERELKGQRTQAKRDYAQEIISETEYRRELLNIRRKLEELKKNKRQALE